MKKKEKRPRKPAELRTKSERDCHFCQEAKGKRSMVQRGLPVLWEQRKERD